MTIDLTEHQRELLTELLEAAHKDTVHELHRTDSISYKQLIRSKIAMIEGLCSTIALTEPVA